MRTVRWMICGVVLALGGVPASLCMWFCGSMMGAGDEGGGAAALAVGGCGTACGSGGAGGRAGARCAAAPCGGQAGRLPASARPSAGKSVCRVCGCDRSPCAPQPRTPSPERPRIDLLTEYMVVVGVRGSGAAEGAIRARMDGGAEGTARSREHAHRQSILCVWVI